MFERYSEKAKRAIFFSTYEAKMRNRSEIGVDDLLLGLLHEDRNLVEDFEIEKLRFVSQGDCRGKNDLPASNHFRNVAKAALLIAEQKEHKTVLIGHILLAIVGYVGTVSKYTEVSNALTFLEAFGFSPENVSEWLERSSRVFSKVQSEPVADASALIADTEPR